MRLFDTRVTEGAFALTGAMDEWDELTESIKENAEGAATAITELKLDTTIAEFGTLAAEAKTFATNVTKAVSA